MMIYYESSGDMMKKLFNRAGFSLLETAMVLTVAGLVFGGIWVITSTISENTRQEKLMQQTSYIISHARAAFGQSRTAPDTTGGAMTAAAIQAGIFPADMISTATAAPRNSYGGDVALSHNVSSLPPVLELSLGNISRPACVALLSRMTRDADVRRQSGITGAGVTDTISQGASYQNFSGDLKQRQITTICTSNSANPQQLALHIAFRYY